MKGFNKRSQFWVLSAATAFGLFAMLAFSEHRLRIETQRTLVAQQESFLGLLNQAQLRLARMSALLRQKKVEVEQLSARLYAETQMVDKLAKDLEVKQGALETLQTELALALQLEEARKRVEVFRTSRRQAPLEPIVIGDAGSLRVVGRVVGLDTEWKFVVFDRGMNAVSIGDVFEVHHGDEPVAEVQVERVHAQVAAARVMPASDVRRISLDDHIIRRAEMEY